MANKPTRKQINALKNAAILIKNNFDTKESYKEITGNPDDKNAQANGNKLYTPEVMNAVKQLLGTDQIIEDNKKTITKFIELVLARYMAGREFGNTAIAALRLLKDIDPELGKSKVEFDNVSKMDEKQLDEEIAKYKKLAEG